MNAPADKRAPTKRSAKSKPIDIASDLSRLGSFDEILEYLITHVTKTIQADRGSLFLHDPVAHQLYTRVALGNLSREIRIDEQSGVAGWVFKNGETVILQAIEEDFKVLFIDESGKEKVLFLTKEEFKNKFTKFL